MYSSRLHLAVIITLISLNYTIAAAKPNVIKKIAQKAVPMVASLPLLFAPLSLNALPSKSATKPQLHERVVPQEENYVGKAVFFEQNGVGQRGIVVMSNGRQAQVTFTTGPGSDGGRQRGSG